MSEPGSDRDADEVGVEELYAETRAYFEAVLNNLHLGVIVLDASFHITFFNRDQTVLFGRMGIAGSMFELIGEPIEQRYPILSLAEWGEAQLEVSRGRSLLRTRVPWPSAAPDGHYRVSVLPLQEGRIAGAVCTTEDISPFVKLEGDVVREGRMAVVGKMAIQLNRDVREPVLSVLEHAETILGQSVVNPVVADAAREIQAGAKQIERAIRKLRMMESLSR